ncbi:hypothetical protein NDU88_011052 [Pleurodeles waltl]|uniref:Uncharacterized protein n=1 Tax=Pleurodeles waltl TaxID=8319 RepID=A0AAV7RZZ7_PLEWA|nr:hypothetical protein NDU88_011052 [Pleurodeles waltl]
MAWRNRSRPRRRGQRRCRGDGDTPWRVSGPPKEQSSIIQIGGQSGPDAPEEGRGLDSVPDMGVMARVRPQGQQRGLSIYWW